MKKPEKVDRGAGWVFLAMDTVPAFLDKSRLPKTPAVWKYRALYLKGDTLVRQWSAAASVTVVAEVASPAPKRGEVRVPKLCSLDIPEVLHYGAAHASRR